MRPTDPPSDLFFSSTIFAPSPGRQADFTSNPEVKKPVRSVRQTRQAVYVSAFSAFVCSKECKKKKKKGREHVIGLSTATKADHQHSLTHMLAASHHTYRGRKHLQAGSQTGERELESRVFVLRETRRVARECGTVSCPPLDGTRAFGTLVLRHERQPRVTCSSAAAWIDSVFNWLLLHLCNFI